MFVINMRPKLQRNPVRTIYQYNRANKDDIKTQCSQMTSTYFERNLDEIAVEDNWLFFKSSILSIMYRIPHRSSKAKTSHPYITKEITREMNKRDRLYKKAIRTKSPKDCETYKTKINCVQRLKESGHSEYLNNVAGESLMTDAKKCWRYVKAQCRESAGIPIFKVGSTSYSSNEDKAKALNAQFSSVFTHDDATSTLANKGPSPYEAIKNLVISSLGVNKQLT